MRPSSRWPAGLVVLFASVVLYGCADRTAIVVEVSSPDLAIPSDIDSITIRAQSEFGAMFEETYPLSATWPHSLSITPPPREAVGGVRIDVTGNLGGVAVTRRVATTTWLPGASRRVSVVLTRSCLAILCEDGYDCVNGRCCLGADCSDPDGGLVDGGMRDAGFDGGLDAPEMDAFVVPDTGVDAPMSVFDGGMDAGRDAGVDAGRDAGTDAPSDAGTDAPLPPGARLVINEIDYDQAGSDTQEFVEIFNAGSATASLDGVVLIFINGSDNNEYARATLSGLLASGAYLVVGVPGQTLTLPPMTTRVDITGFSSMQNSPDGVALVNTTTMTVIDRLSYGTPPVTAANLFGTPTTLVEMSAATVADSATATRTMCRRPNGSDTDNSATDWAACAAATPGAANP